MQNVGRVDKFISNSYGLSGPVSRSAGIKNDVRFNMPYEFLNHAPITTIYGTQGDNLTRFFLRFEETLISLQYIEYLLTVIDHKNFKTYFKNITNDFKIKIDERSKPSMEDTIYQFKSFSEGYNIKKNKTYTKVESPRGEFGVTLIS